MLHWMLQISIVVFIVLLYGAQAFRILNYTNDALNGTHAVFEPYEHGHVGYYGDPTNPVQERVNEGAPFSPDTPRLFFYEQPKQSCPGMVGPIRDQEYYCYGREYGYCDRRSGLCVCNEGYTGLDCTTCKASYYKNGGLCYPKKNCPNDCSRGGSCDYATGVCTCLPTRRGTDCSQVFCNFDPLCVSCTSTRCLSCVEGFFVNPATNECVSCKVYDPRCLVCDSTGCLECADLILNSVRRSGARNIDAPLPFDELKREFSFHFSYGSQDPRVFDEAETFYLLPPSKKPLNETSQTCTQGVNADASWICKPFPISNRICGHFGVFTFGSPTYTISESAQNITVTVRRSGGGIGNATIAYGIQHITSSPNDVSPTAFYTSSQELFFTEGVVELAFQLTIHNDHVVEANETFRLFLQQPVFDSMASLGNQRATLVTILDDDSIQADATLSYIVSANNTLQRGGVAGNNATFQVQTVLGTGALKTTGGDVILVESYATDIEDDHDDLWQVYRTKEQGIVVDHNNGTYTVTWRRTHASTYIVAVYLLFPEGLSGNYYRDAWLGGGDLPAITRIDRHLNFTWGNGSVFPGASDYLSVRWSGWLKPKATDDITFHVMADDHVRLWIGDTLLIDQWDDSFQGRANATLKLDSSLFYSLALEYRELVGNAEVHLFWSSSTFAKEIIPAKYLYSGQHIRGSPFANISITPSVAANATTSVIQGITSSIAGEQFSFLLFLKDLYGNQQRVPVAKNDFEARLTLVTDWSLGGIGSKQNDAHIEWDRNREAFEVTLEPLLSGEYNLSVWINTVLLVGCPIQINIMPGELHATRSVLAGDGLLANRIAGIATTVVLEARDINRNRIYHGGSQVQIEIRAFHTAQTRSIEVGTVVDNGDGTYLLTYTPRLVGSYNVRITYHGIDIHNSPYLVSIVPNSPVGATSSATGSGIFNAFTNVQTAFQVLTRDMNGNDVKQGGATLEVVLTHPTKGNVTGTCNDLLTGLYACAYTAKYVSNLTQLHVGVSCNGGIEPIIGSPFTIDVAAGPALGSLCFGEGTALVSSVAGVQTNFTVWMRDAFGNDKINAGHEVINIAITRVAISSTVVTSSAGVIVSYVDNGKYLVSYMLQTKGRYAIQVQVDNVEIHGSPFTMYTYPAEAFASTTTLDLLTPQATVVSPLIFAAGSLITARLTTRDAFGNVLESGGYLFNLDEIAGFLEKPLIDEGNGSYFLMMRPIESKIFPFQPRIFLSGGLNASYYANTDLNGGAIFMRQDPTIDFDFGIYPPKQTDSLGTFSIRWEGYFLPKYSEVYTFEVEIDGGANLRIDNTTLLVGMWAKQNHAPSPSLKIYLVGNQLVSFELSYSKPQSAPTGKVKLFWKSLSQSREIIPPSRMFTAWNIVNNIPLLRIMPDNAHSGSFTAEFPLKSAVNNAKVDHTVVTVTSGEKFVFHVIARDRYGNQRLTGGDKLHVLFPQLPYDVNISPYIVDFVNGTYEVSFSPIQGGQFSMIIAATPISLDVYEGLGMDSLISFLRPYTIHQSPFTLVVVPNKPSAAASTMIGGGFSHAIAGKSTIFQLQLRDLNSNRIKSDFAISELNIQLLNVDSGAVVQAQILAGSDGIYDVSYVITGTGIYRVQLSVDNGASFVTKSTTLRVFPNIASSLTSRVSGGSPGLGPQISVNRNYTYQVVLRDAFDNPMEIGGNNLFVVLRGPDVVHGNVTDLQNGDYIVTYQVTVAGMYEIQTHLANNGHGLVGYYFPTTQFIRQTAVLTIDPVLHFDWQTNQTMRMYPRVQWKGFIKPRYTEEYTFTLRVFPAAAIYIDEVTVIDVLSTPPISTTGVAQGVVSLIAGRLHAITVEYRSPARREVFGSLTLQWQSARQSLEIVPATAFIPEAQELQPRLMIVAID